MKYSVLLMYPEHIAGFYGETYYGFSTSDTQEAAIEDVKMQAAKSYFEGDDVDADDLRIFTQDFVVCLVTEGHNEAVPYKE